MYTFLNPVYAYIIGGGLFAILLLFLVIAKGDEMFCTNFFTKWIFKTFNPIPGSALFWNGMFWILFVSTGLVWPEIAFCISITLSIIYLLCSFDEMELENHTWIFAAMLLYGVIALVGIGTGLYYIWTNTIGRFNNYLDKKKDANNN
jgi:hypothetical protein